MHKRQLTVVGIIMIGVTILFATATFRQQAQDKSQSGQEEATIVMKGQVTDKEREYSKEYKKLYSWREGRKLSELRGGKQDVSVILDEPELLYDPSANITGAEFLKELSCNADAIVVGSIESKSAHLTDDETFVYTEYEFSVKNILKNNLTSSIEINDSIKITRPGGVIKLDNRRITVEDKSYETLQMKKVYLLFLRFVSSANGYVVASNKGDFTLEKNSYQKLTKRTLPKEIESGNSSSKLLSNVNNAVSTGCNQNLTGGNNGY